MSYVEKNLLAGEQVVYQAKIHWYIFLPGIVLFLVGLGLVIAGGKEGTVITFGLFGIVAAAVLLLKAFIVKATTELAVTSKRVIAKVGLIRRNTIELNHSKVESFNVDQSITGRLLGFGTLTVNGTGGGKTPIPNIDKPLSFRREAAQVIDKA